MAKIIMQKLILTKINMNEIIMVKPTMDKLEIVLNQLWAYLLWLNLLR